MKYTLCADEIFIQTILWNSPFRERMHCTNNANTGSMREIDWSMAAPIYGRTMIIKRLLTLIKYLHGNSIQTRWELSTRFKNYI